MSLYNLKSADGQWRITKFSNDLEVESSYLLTAENCECPAGHRPSCRHRQMLPKMLAHGAEDSGMFYDFDRDQFFEPLASEAADSERSDTDLAITDPQMLPGLSQTVRTTIIYGSSDTDSPSINPWPLGENATISAPTCGVGGAGSNPVEASIPTIPGAPHPSIGYVKRRI